jgi:2-dehydro-3-deoxygalactonokinase
MRWSDGFIAVDWGTSNRRAYVLAADGALTDMLEDGLGVLNVEPGGFGAAVSQLRERLGDRPLLLSGMIGSNRGWVEAPYVSCPAGLGEIAASLRWIDPTCCIVPGVRSAAGDAADVMRGEETQIIGAGDLPSDAVVCLPGTHTKWAIVSAGSIVRFRTVMAGEIFALLQKGSILADQLREPVEPNSAFKAGVAHALGGADLLAGLFSIRARFLLDGDRTGSAYASGLLVGSDVRAGLDLASGREIGLVGRPELTALHAEALAIAGIEAVRVDGGEAFVAGARAIAERL